MRPNWKEQLVLRWDGPTRPAKKAGRRSIGDHRRRPRRVDDAGQFPVDQRDVSCRHGQRRTLFRGPSHDHRTWAALVVFFSFAPWSAQAQAVNKVPQFDIATACRAMIAQSDIEHGQSQADDVKHCIESEKQEREQLEKGWSQFSAIARTTCLGVSSVGSVKPVYSELMACLERMDRSKR